MASSTGAKRKGNFKLDIDDMERRLVEFRVSLDREKRRCQAAKMTDKFEKLLTDKLAEIGSQLTTTNPGGDSAACDGGGGAGGSGQDGARSQQTLGPRLTNIDEESVGRLLNFLTSAITMSGRVDQLDQIHEVLRKCLLETRLKRVRTAAEMAPGEVNQLEPLCVFCGNLFGQSQVEPARRAIDCHCGVQNHATNSAEPEEVPIPTMDDLRASFSQYDPPAPNSSTSDQQQRHEQVTPPASNPTTPEVGDQAGATSYTPSFGGGGGNQVHPQERQQVFVLRRPEFVTQQQPHASTSPPPPPLAQAPQQQQQQQRLRQPQKQQQQQSFNNNNNLTNASDLSARFVMPSDESSTDSNMSSNSVRDVLNKLSHTPTGYHEPRQLSSTPIQPEREKKKMPPVAAAVAAAAEEEEDHPSKLVIDEGLDRFFTQDRAPKVSFVSKSIKNGPRSKKRPKRLNISTQ